MGLPFGRQAAVSLKRTSPQTFASLFIVLSNERPILGDNPKAHNENRFGFHEKWQFL